MKQHSASVGGKTATVSADIGGELHKHVEGRHAAKKASMTGLTGAYPWHWSGAWPGRLA